VIHVQLLVRERRPVQQVDLLRIEQSAHCHVSIAAVSLHLIVSNNVVHSNAYGICRRKNLLLVIGGLMEIVHEPVRSSGTVVTGVHAIGAVRFVAEYNAK
jgi:hypothetical protein